MNAVATTATQTDPQEGKGSVSAASRLSTDQRIFCETFVGNGGRGDLAAVAAGVDPDKATVQACRWLCRQTVAAYIHELCITFAHSALPVAIQALVEIASDKEALRKDRIKAAACLVELGGMAAPKGGVQVNVGVQVNGQQAQALIGSVWDARARRLSDIPPAMPDTKAEPIDAVFDELEQRADDKEGGDRLQGPAGGDRPLPAHGSENSPVSRNSDDDPFEAFDDRG